jgi:hypothetical protein
MGFDISYQAIPEDKLLLIWARHKPSLGENLEFFQSYALMSQEQLERRASGQLFMAFVHLARQTIQQYPGIEHRNLYLGRRWDILNYLLSDQRRKGEKDDGSHWVEKAILGGQVLNKLTQTTIGFPIRYLCPTEVSIIREMLETVTIGMLRCYWDPQAMSKSGVYKIRGDESNDDFEWLQEDFEKLKAFYDLVEVHHEGILTFMS